MRYILVVNGIYRCVEYGKNEGRERWMIWGLSFYGTSFCKYDKSNKINICRWICLVILCLYIYTYIYIDIFIVILCIKVLKYDVRWNNPKDVFECVWFGY